MADITRGTATLGQVATTRTVSEIHPANIDFLQIPGKVAAEVMYSGQLVYLHTDQKFYLSDADGTAAEKAVTGVVVNDVTAANKPVTVMILGTMGGYTNLTPGARLYASVTKGEMADTAATASIPVGIAISDTEVFFFPIFSKSYTAAP